MISIEDTYKEVGMYKKSGGNNELMTQGAIGMTTNSAGNFATANNALNQNYEDLKQS